MVILLLWRCDIELFKIDPWAGGGGGRGALKEFSVFFIDDGETRRRAYNTCGEGNVAPSNNAGSTHDGGGIQTWIEKGVHTHG